LAIYCQPKKRPVGSLVPTMGGCWAGTGWGWPWVCCLKWVSVSGRERSIEGSTCPVKLDLASPALVVVCRSIAPLSLVHRTCSISSGRALAMAVQQLLLGPSSRNVSTWGEDWHFESDSPDLEMSRLQEVCKSRPLRGEQRTWRLYGSFLLSLDLQWRESPIGSSIGAFWVFPELRFQQQQQQQRRLRVSQNPESSSQLE
jgi:hypothetical protein